MNAPTPPPSAAGGAPRQGAEPAPGHWLDALQAVWRDLPGLLSDRMDLLALELRRAGRALAQIVALLVSAAILAVTAWIALWAGIAMGLVELGAHWSVAAALVLVINAGVAWWEVRRLRALLALLQLPATRRHLTPRSWDTSGPPAAAPVPPPAPTPPSTPASTPASSPAPARESAP